jgi:RimJ/RimL family protein N-acetyltransferase
MEYPILTPRLRIEPLQSRDVDAFVSYRREPNVARYQSWDEDFSIDQGRALVDSQIGVAFPEKGEWIQLGLRLVDDYELVGDVAIHSVDSDSSEVEIGFSIATQYQRQGFAKEGVSHILQAISDRGLTSRFVAHTDDRNVGSIALLGALGFLERPDQSWVEEFKGETVRVLRFERD